MVHRNLRGFSRRRLFLYSVNRRDFENEMLFVAPQRNEAIAISFWDKQVHAEAYNHIAYLDVLRILSKVVEEMPIVQTFEVASSSSHETRC